MLKKLIAVAVALLLVALPVMADDAEAPIVTVTVSDAGSIVAADVRIQLSDADEDGLYTVNDALILIHDAHCPDGYEFAYTEYGVSIVRLWAVDNGGSYGVCINDESALSLTQELENGDRIYAYTYADLETWSDMYTYFQADEAGNYFLYANGYDEAWNPVTYSVGGVFITVNGELTEIVTADDGSFDLAAAIAPFVGTADQVLVSAVSEDLVLVPPVLVLNLSESVAE